MPNNIPLPLALCRADGLPNLVIVMGNCVQDCGTVWCQDFVTGDRVEPRLEHLHEEEEQPGPEGLVPKIEAWAEAGNSDAAWWLGWWHEGTNHPKSVWYYMAALRRNPKDHGWALRRIYGDARSACMREGVPRPDLSFLSDVQEFCGAREWGDWREAISRAKTAVHTSANR